MDYFRFVECLQFPEVDAARTKPGTSWVLNRFPLDNALSGQLEHLYAQGHPGATFRLCVDEFNKFAVNFRSMQVFFLGQAETTLFMERYITAPVRQCTEGRRLVHI